MKKILGGIIIVLTVFIVGIYSSVNADVPQNYKLDSYSMNEEVMLDETTFKINDYKIYERNTETDGDDNLELTLKVSIKNITQDNMPLRDVLTSTKISYKTYFQDYSEVYGDYEKIRNLKPQESIDLEIVYELAKYEMSQLGKGGEIRFYPPKSSFKNQITNEYADGHLYGKYIKLGEY